VSPIGIIVNRENSRHGLDRVAQLLQVIAGWRIGIRTVNVEPEPVTLTTFDLTFH